MENNSKQSKALYRLHAGLPRQGPGSDEVTASTLSRLPKLSATANIYDLGCGPGRASLVLARALKQRIVCIDLQENFIEELRNSAFQLDLLPFIDARCGDMAKLDCSDGSVHLIWCEGAIYCIGFDNGLSVWRQKLVDDGIVVCSELSWLVPEVSDEPMQFWQRNYPGMRTVQANVSAAERLGFKCLEHFTLSSSCWWDEFYNPWLEHLQRLKAEDNLDSFLRLRIENAEEEIDLYRRFNREYGYEVYILQNS